MTSSALKVALRRIAKAILFLISVCALAAAQAPTFTSFDAPDASHAQFSGTFVVAINQNGVITGWYDDTNLKGHAFVRQANGQITEFDPPGMIGSQPTAINLRGQIVGSCSRTTGPVNRHAFLRSPSGGFVGLDIAGASDTVAAGINDSGAITGYYRDANGFHGFLRDSGGNRTLFDAPGAGSGSDQGTLPVGINVNGEVAGYFSDSNGAIHGFARDAFGNFSTFDAPGNDTSPTAINASGQVVGTYADSVAVVRHSFLRDAAGNITTQDMPGAADTFAASINDAGSVVGEITNGKSFFAGYREFGGTFTGILAPSPDMGLGAVSINNNGRITGSYADAAGAYHGFVQ